MQMFPRFGFTPLGCLILVLAGQASQTAAQEIRAQGPFRSSPAQSPDQEEPSAADSRYVPYFSATSPRAATRLPTTNTVVDRPQPPGAASGFGQFQQRQAAQPAAPTAARQMAVPASSDSDSEILDAERKSPMRPASRQAQFASTRKQQGRDTPSTLDQEGLSELRQGFGDVRSRLSKVEDQLGVISKPSYPSYRVSGFMQMDTGTFSQDANSRAILGNIQNGTDFRRARLLATGNLTEQTQYWAEVDFAAAGRPSFMDMWGQQADVPFFGNVRLGQYRQPVTLDGAVNVRHLEFMEYSSAFSAFDPFRRVGVASWFLSDDERSFVNYGIYGTGSTFYNGTNPSNGGTVYNSLGGDNRFATSLGDTGASFAIRGTHLLYYDPNADNRYFLHVGGGYNFSQIGGGGTSGPFARSYEARTIPEFFMGDAAAGGTIFGGTPNVLDTGRFQANNFSIFHLETCGSYGPAHFQAEWVATTVSQVAGPLVFLNGAYLQAGYFLTGENVGYNKYMGAIDYNVKPFTNFFGLGRHSTMCGWGAWELACRLSYLDLNGSNIKASNQIALPPGGPNGTNPFTVPPGQGGINQGTMTDVTLALNWWWNPFTRMQLNYIHSMVQSKVHGANALDVLCARAQFEF